MILRTNPPEQNASILLGLGTKGEYSMSADPTLLVEQDGHVATVTMNRPEAVNAFDLEMLCRMWDVWQKLDNDPEIRCVILTGAGGNFCAGADLKMMHGNQEDNPWHAKFKADPDLHWKALLRHYDLKKPLIAAVEGVAVGGGTEILQATDIRVVGEGASLGLTEPKWGLFPLGGSTTRLPRQIPYTMAMDVLLTGRMLTAQEALSMGLVGHVVPKGEALAKAQKLASKIAANGPLAVQAIKRAAKEGLQMSEQDSLKNGLQIGSEIVFKSEDAKEGPRAFAEKRKPNFRGC